MGYTHYFTFKECHGKTKEVERAYQRAIKQCDKVIKAYYAENRGTESSLSGYSAHATGYGGIMFNGARGNVCEDFILREHFKQNFDASHFKGFNFCKTRGYYYDEVVTACLCILKRYLKGYVDVTSDGYWCDWTAGAQLASEVLNMKINVPSNIERRTTLKAV